MKIFDQRIFDTMSSNPTNSASVKLHVITFCFVEIDKHDGKKNKAVGTTNKNYFPFLDMEMYRSSEGNLQFRVHLKENQVLNYLIRGSTHTDACFAAIPTGVMKRLASLTTRTEDSYNKNRGFRVNKNG
jgi:hypothetical protein